MSIRDLELGTVVEMMKIHKDIGALWGNLFVWIECVQISVKINWAFMKGRVKCKSPKKKLCVVDIVCKVRKSSFFFFLLFEQC
jgi:hypothetical protein